MPHQPRSPTGKHSRARCPSRHDLSRGLEGTGGCRGRNVTGRGDLPGAASSSPGRSSQGPGPEQSWRVEEETCALPSPNTPAENDKECYGTWQSAGGDKEGHSGRGMQSKPPGEAAGQRGCECVPDEMRLGETQQAVGQPSLKNLSGKIGHLHFSTSKMPR